MSGAGDPAAVTRRAWLARVGAVAAAAGGGVLLWRACGGRASAAPPDPRRDVLAAFYRDRTSARAVGLACLRAGVTERAPAELVAALLSGEVAAALARADAATAFAALRRQHVADFAAEQTVEADGWLLSRTEARLCALVALGEPG